MRWALVAACAVVAVLVALVALARPPRIRVIVNVEPPSAEGPAPESNIERRDYVGPQVCIECHEEKGAAWRKHLHRSMNALAGDAEIAGNWDDVTISYGSGTARFYRHGAELRADLDDGRGDERSYVVTRTIGSHFIQEYVVRQLRGPEPSGHRIYQTEIRLPFGFWRRKGAWFHQQYYDSWFGPEYDGSELSSNPYQPQLDSWEPRCPWCHNTYAFELRIFRSQGRKRIGNGIERHFTIDGEPTGRARQAENSDLPLDELVTVGISCESCHLGGRAHAVEDGPDIHFGPASTRISAQVAWVENGRDDPRVINSLCAQCHSAPSPRFPTGAARRNSSEALDLAAGACSPAISCVDCHDPHVRGGPEIADKAVAACVGCHPSKSDTAAARAHSRHSTEAASCLDCHMPRWVQGFSDVIRSHRIAPPFEPAMVLAGQPNACNLCHLDRSVAWTRTQLALYWGRKYSVAGPGDLEPAGAQWLASADPFIVVTAAAAYARSSHGPLALGAIIERLDQPIAYYRMRLLFAVEEILGRALGPTEYQPTAGPRVRARQARRLRRRFPTSAANRVESAP